MRAHTTCVVKRNLFAQACDLSLFKYRKIFASFSLSTCHIFFAYFFSLPNSICCTTIFKVLYVCNTSYYLNFTSRTWILKILASEHH